MRVTASPDSDLWVEISGRPALRDRRRRAAAVRLVTERGDQALAQLTFPGARMLPWLMRRIATRAIASTDGRSQTWSWRAEPELLVAMVQVQEATPMMRMARANLPMEYDDTEDFRTALGLGEKLVMPTPPAPGAQPFATYTWDLQTHLVTMNALSNDRERFGTLIPALDDLARSIRLLDDMTGGESQDVLRLPPA